MSCELGIMATTTTAKQVKLDKECELRVEVSPDSPLRIRLVNGTAEIFGTEMPPQVWLSFPPFVKFAVIRKTEYCLNFMCGASSRSIMLQNIVKKFMNTH